MLAETSLLKDRFIAIGFTVSMECEEMFGCTRGGDEAMFSIGEHGATVGIMCGDYTATVNYDGGGIALDATLERKNRCVISRFDMSDHKVPKNPLAAKFLEIARKSPYDCLEFVDLLSQ